MLSGRLIHVWVGSSGAGGGGADVTSARNRVVEARGTLAEAQARERELPADAKESERISARNNVVSATNDLTEAEQDLATATTDAADTTAQAAEHMVKIDPQIEQLGKLPGLLVNGLFESLGIGDIFPDFTQTSAWKSFAGGLSAFKGPIQGLVEGNSASSSPAGAQACRCPSRRAPVSRRPKAVAGSPSPVWVGCPTSRCHHHRRVCTGRVARLARPT